MSFADGISAPTLLPPTTPSKSPDADGFIQRWLILEPLPANGLTDSAVQKAVKADDSLGLLKVFPTDGQKVSVDDKQLTWHAVDTSQYNVNLYHFAKAL